MIDAREKQELAAAEAEFSGTDWRQRRLEICLSCPACSPAVAGIALTERCRICGCFVRLKTKLKSQTCAFTPPRWHKVCCDGKCEGTCRK